MVVASGDSRPAMNRAAAPAEMGVVVSIKAEAKISSRRGRGEIVWDMEVDHPGAQFLRLHFSEIRDQQRSTYEVIVRDMSYRVVRRYPKAEFSAKASFWTDLIWGSYALVEVVALGDTPPTGLSFRVPQYVYQQEGLKIESLTRPTDDRKYTYIYASDKDIRRTGKSVALIVFNYGGLSLGCTGFMISDNLLLTNEHCVPDKEVCKSAVAIFGYEYRLTRTNPPQPVLNTYPDQYPCKKLEDVDSELDFALLRLTGKPGVAQAWGHLRLATREPRDNEQLVLIQHPFSQPKQVSKTGCTLSTANAPNLTGNKSDFGHLCDTLNGSSGAPVLGEDFTVIGMHHLGFDLSEPRWSDENRAVRATKLHRRLTPFLSQAVGHQ